MLGECLEITGVPDSISNDDLEKTTIKTFDNLDVAIDPSNIEDWHWFKNNGPKEVIIKFARRKNANLIWKNKNKLKGMNLCPIGINNPVFINDSFCSYYKMIWQKNKKIWSSKHIHVFWVFNSTLRLKLTASGHVHVITHCQDLDKLFPENELLRDQQLVPCLFILFIFTWVYGCLRLFYSSGVLIFISLSFWKPFCFFYFLLKGVYTTTFYFIDILVSIVTQHMIIYASFVWQ